MLSLKLRKLEVKIAHCSITKLLTFMSKSFWIVSIYLSLYLYLECTDFFLLIPTEKNKTVKKINNNNKITKYPQGNMYCKNCNYTHCWIKLCSPVTFKSDPVQRLLFPPQVFRPSNTSYFTVQI